MNSIRSESHLAYKGVGIALTNMLLATTFLFFAYAHALRFLENPRLSLLLIVAVEGLIALMLLIRRDPDQTAHNWRTWLTTFLGTFLPLLLRPTDAPSDLLVGQALQLVAFVLQVAGVLSLNRSFGLLPAHRGIKSNGLYRFVRHPLYSAYALAHLGYLVNNFSVYNATIIAVTTAFQVARILNEERLLMDYPDYADYAGRTRWRLIPAVW